MIINKYLTNHKFFSITLIIICIGTIAIPKVYNYTVSAQEKIEDSSECEKRAALINNRSKLLVNYKQSDERKYQLDRKKWANRISYASQWVKDDAESARDKLYQHDKIHNSLKAELDEQIDAYKYLEQSPLDCSDSNKAQLTAKLEEVKGIKDGKAVGGQALIEKLKREESRYKKSEFGEAAREMIENLHRVKDSDHVPSDKPFEVNTN